MGNSKLRGKDLRQLGYRSHRTISIAMEVMAAKPFKYQSKTEKLQTLSQIMSAPQDFINHPELEAVAACFQEEEQTFKPEQTALLDEPGPYRVFGRKHIQQQAIDQLEIAMRLPVAEAGALMPDGHQGYGLPIGGVLATKEAVIPYAVGLDIGCRMSLSLFDIRPEFLNRYHHQVKTALKDHTYFGQKGLVQAPKEHEVLDRPEFREIALLKNLNGKAARQLGTSGSGNHFVEFGSVEMMFDNQLGLPEGRYMAILSHSGSRGLGATIAGHYTQLAMERCPLPREARHLAWLDLNTEEGMEYWLAMNLAGDYAKACHDVIHETLSKALGVKPITRVENHHNFAWKERQADGRELIVHRKGATPAAKNVLGIIPGSMTAPGYIVSGLGNGDSLQSAAHGAGRKMSRTRARSTFTQSSVKKMLKHTGVTLIGGGPDEAPLAYKDLEVVMGAQRELVKVEGKFFPKLVRMDKP